MVTGGELLLERAALRAIVRSELRVTGLVLGEQSAGVRSIVRAHPTTHVDSALTPKPIGMT
jgi:hypothetical protein